MLEVGRQWCLKGDLIRFACHNHHSSWSVHKSGGNAEWMKVHSVTWQVRDYVIYAGEVELEICKEGRFQTKQNKTTWRMKQNRNWGSIGHEENLVKVGVKVPDLRKLVRGLSSGRWPDWGGKIMRGASFEVTLRHPTRDSTRALYMQGLVWGS